MTFWSIVFAIGAAQAVLLALALWRWPVNTTANRILSVWIGLIALDLAIKSLYFHGPSPWLFKPFRLTQLLPFLYGSLFFLYVRALTQRTGLARRDTWHFVGFAFALLVNADVFAFDRAQVLAFQAYLRAGGYWPRSPWLDVVLFAYGVSYVVAALVRVHRYRRQLLQRRADADRMSLRWIDVMAVSQIVIWCIALVQWQFDIPWIDYPLIYGGIVAWVFAMGYLSLGQSAVAAVEATPETPVAQPLAGGDDARFPPGEARVGALMGQEQVYPRAALTIGQLARRSGYPEYLVSAVINRRLEGNFWEYINRQRVEAARACLADAADTRTVLDIAYDCGFTSKSTFNAAFKRQLGLTPSAYRQSQSRGAGAVSTGQSG